MTLFPTIRSFVMGGALVAGVAAWAAPGVAYSATGEPLGATTEDNLRRGLAAQSDAAAARDHAAYLRAQGGPAYTSGAVDRANLQAQRDDASASAYFARAGVPSCQALAPSQPAPSKEVAAAQAKVKRLRQQGGWAYKTGAVDRAEADVRLLVRNGF